MFTLLFKNKVPFCKKANTDLWEGSFFVSAWCLPYLHIVVSLSYFRCISLLASDLFLVHRLVAYANLYFLFGVYFLSVASAYFLSVSVAYFLSITSAYLLSGSGMHTSFLLLVHTSFLFLLHTFFPLLVHNCFLVLVCIPSCHF
jgi:hypothetical protein